jgi:hypothetical protein
MDYLLNEFATRMESERRLRDEEYDARPSWRWMKNAYGGAMVNQVMKVAGLLVMLLRLR